MMFGNRFPFRTFRRRSASSAAALTLAIAVVSGTAAETRAQGLLYNQTPSYNYAQGYGDGINYNADYMSYGLPGVGISPWNPIVNAQLNLGMRTARYNMLNSWSAQSYQAANLFNQEAISQAINNARRSPVMQPSYEVNRRAVQPAEPEQPAPQPLPRADLLTPAGAVRWPASLPSVGILNSVKSAAEAAIAVATKEFVASGRASIQSVAEAKSRLFAYGQPAIKLVAQKDKAKAQELLKFFVSLEHALDSLAGE